MGEIVLSYQCRIHDVIEIPYLLKWFCIVLSCIVVRYIQYFKHVNIQNIEYLYQYFFKNTYFLVL